MAKSQTFNSLGCGKNIPADLYHAGEFEAFYFMDVDHVEGNYPHFHNYYELILVMQGNIDVAAEGKRYHIPEGSIIIIPPHVEHCTIVLKNTKIYERIILHWLPSFLDILTKTGRMPEGDFFQKVSIINCSSSDTAIYRILLERFMAELHTLPCKARLPQGHELRCAFEYAFSHKTRPAEGHELQGALGCHLPRAACGPAAGYHLCSEKLSKKPAQAPCQSASACDQYTAELPSGFTFPPKAHLPSGCKRDSSCKQNDFSGDKFSLKIQEATITELLLRCARDICSIKARPGMESSLMVSRVIGYINDHFQEPDLSLNYLSKHFFVSSGNLSKMFRTYTGTTVYQYIIQKRLFCAQNLLAKDSSVLEACLGCGFQDYTSFLKAFRRTFHCTPKEFQKSVKDRDSCAV